MRIDPRFAAPSSVSTAAPRSAGVQRFSLEGGSSAAKAGRTHAAAPLSTLDALLAVQGEGDPTERRRRSLKRGHDLLDGLDRLKAALLSGRVGQGQLQNLAAQIGGQRGSSGDPGLDDVVAHIELRVQVELAKLGRA